MIEYFIYNLPKFFSQHRIRRKLCEALGNVQVDLFTTKNSNNLNDGMARLECEHQLSLGEVDIGLRYPVFLKIWVDKSSELDTVSDVKVCSEGDLSSDATCCFVSARVESLDIFPSQKTLSIREQCSCDVSPIISNFNLRISLDEQNWNLKSAICSNHCQLRRCHLCRHQYLRECGLSNLSWIELKERMEFLTQTWNQIGNNDLYYPW